MKREILFRGKTQFSSNWEYGFLSWHDLGHGKNYFINNQAIISETVGQLWMQIGKLKLFEGDVFEFPIHNVRFVVKYNEKRHQFCIAHPDELGLKYFNPWQCPDESWIEEFMKDAVLIGNIYDNKELLK